MVERFNGRIAEVLATTRFDSAQNLADTLTGYVRLYNHQIPQKALGHIAPIQALKDWQQKSPERFKKRVYNLTGLDRQRVMGVFMPVNLQHSQPFCVSPKLVSNAIRQSSSLRTPDSRHENALDSFVPADCSIAVT